MSWAFSLHPRAEEFPHPSPRREPLRPWGWDEACVSTRYLQTALGSESTQEGTGLIGVPRVTEQKGGDHWEDWRAPCWILQALQALLRGIVGSR